jgi:glycine/D-amino acid oxidase-like deaminating enzyme
VDSHAIVVGASIAGLLAARVLSEHFERVTVLEKDWLPGPDEARGAGASLAGTAATSAGAAADIDSSGVSGSARSTQGGASNAPSTTEEASMNTQAPSA